LVRTGDRKRVAAVRLRKLGESAVDLVTRKLSFIAQILSTGLAESTDTAGLAQPGNPYALPHSEATDVLAHLLDHANDLVTKDDRKPWMLKFAVPNMEISAANAAGLDPHHEPVS
jgi:hypothetical protein